MPAVRSVIFHTRQFKAGNSQAVRLPAQFAYPPETELTVTRDGGKVIIEPAAETLDSFVNFLFSVSDKYDGQRIEADLPERDWS
ncbi:MAG: AbrB family transcriptional regulator [Burkholderiaceae bacterium]|jgi:antitoxin VapB|nr:AbrB family transcriptional regulator [Burkholderiaceae bacterium]